jgi:DNA-directed RNA polymerase specialized sigma24 family protein
MEESLKYDRLVKAYRCGEMEREELEAAVFTGVREQIVRCKLEGMNREAAYDFASWIYPRISRAIDRYRDAGSSFDTYLNTVVKLSAREYCFRLKDHHIVEQAWWDARAKEMVMCAEEEPPPYEETKRNFRGVRNRKQVLALLLKSYYYLSEDYLDRAAPAIGMDRKELGNMVDTLRNQRLCQDEKIRALRERVHNQFYRCLAFEERMLAVSPGSAHGQRMKKSLEKARKRLASMRRHLASIRIEAPNWQIANIIGVPKGTVDSNLHALKQGYSKSQNKRDNPPGSAQRDP